MKIADDTARAFGRDRRWGRRLLRRLGKRVRAEYGWGIHGAAAVRFIDRDAILVALGGPGHFIGLVLTGVAFCEAGRNTRRLAQLATIDTVLP